MNIPRMRNRIAAKAVGWRLTSTLITFMVVMLVSGIIPESKSVEFASLVAGFDLVVKLLAYCGYEKIWHKMDMSSNKEGFCIWMTGLSGAGKTTIAKALIPKLESLTGKQVERLDGDVLRTNICADLGFSKEDRDENIRRVSYVASYLSQKCPVVCAFISPFTEARDKARQMSTNFIEVHVDCPIDVCAERDVKGLYAKAKAGEIADFTGISSPYESPENPEVYLDTSKMSLDECVDTIFNYIKSQIK